MNGGVYNGRVNKPTNSAQVLRGLLVPVFIPSVLMSIAEYSLLPIIPSSAQKLHATIPQAGLIAGLLMAGVLVADLPAGRLVDRIGERMAMIWGAIAGALGVFLVAFSNNLWLMGIGVFSLGIGVAIFSLARHAFFAEHIPLNFRARALSLLGGTFRAGAFIGPLLGSALISIWGVHSVYWLSACASLTAGVILLSTKPEQIKSTPLTQKGGIWLTAKRQAKPLLTLGVGSAILGAIRTTRQVGLPLWALVISLSPSESSLYIGLAGVLDFALFYTSGQIMDRWGRFWAAVPPLLGLAVLHIFIFAVHDGTGFLLMAGAMALANGFGSGIILTIGADLAPSDSRNEFLASYRLITDVGVASAPPVLSLLTGFVGLAGAMAAFGVLGIFGAGLMWRYIPRFIPKPVR
jgi:MFS family permease